MNSTGDAAMGAAVRAFYERHPYPGPVDALDTERNGAGAAAARRAQYHLAWPERPLMPARSILVAGCGTRQAARHALDWPEARVVGIDLSETAIASTGALKARHRLDNLELQRLAVEEVARLGMQFDQIVCTGVLHHLPDPDAGLRALAGVLAPGGAMQVMVYAPYGRAGVYMMQAYNRLLGVEATTDEIAALSETLRSLPRGHPLRPLLETAPDFRYAAGMADALLHPQDRPYSVPEFRAFIARAGLTFDRWQRQAPYLPDCGAMRGTPHHARLAAMPSPDQHAAMELFRGTMLRHTAIVHRGDRPPQDAVLKDDRWLDAVPLRMPGTICVEESLPPGAAGVLINRNHTDTDIYLPIGAAEARAYKAIDGERRVRDIIGAGGTAAFLRRLWQHDQIVFDLSGG